jgi:type I site-specific restriction endonuclease
MSTKKNLLHETISSLKQQRDELALKMHLAEAEAKQEFDETIVKLDTLTAEYDPLKDAVGESAENVVESLKLVAGEVVSSFDRIRKSL